LDFIKGAEKIIKDYGYWPTFHDDYVTKIIIDGSSIDFFIKMVKVPKGFEDYFICITFDKVEKFEFAGELFGTASIIFDLVFTKEELVTCQILSSLGTSGEIQAKEVLVRKLFIEVDLGGVQDIRELHSLLASNLDFPEFYGMNWNAFWDAITGLVSMPKTLAFKGWNKFEEKFKEDADILKDLLCEYKDTFDDKFRVTFR
jgi:RNAse (barnase) inhibitor barstar